MANNVRINKFGGPGPRQDRRAQRREEAAQRNETYGQSSIARRVAILDAKLGKGVGAKRQRARLAAEARGA